MSDAHCPWCSAELPEPAPERCPSCDASLVESATEEMPGLTSVDPDAARRAAPAAKRPRGILGWLSGEYPAEEAPAAAPATEGVLSPPAEEVRREMLRMELARLEAEGAARLAEAELLAAEAGAEWAAEPAPETAAEDADEPADETTGPDDEAAEKPPTIG